jgi:hypothetical protein
MASLGIPRPIEIQNSPEAKPHADAPTDVMDGEDKQALIGVSL